jgi:hypothetical protein
MATGSGFREGQVQKLKQKDVEALLADLAEKLPEMVPGLP